MFAAFFTKERKIIENVGGGSVSLVENEYEYVFLSIASLIFNDLKTIFVYCGLLLFRAILKCGLFVIFGERYDAF